MIGCDLATARSEKLHNKWKSQVNYPSPGLMHIAQIPLHCSTQAAYSCGQRESWGKDHRKVESGEQSVKLWRAATQSFEHRQVVIFYSTLVASTVGTTFISSSSLLSFVYHHILFKAPANVLPTSHFSCPSWPAYSQSSKKFAQIEGCRMQVQVYKKTFFTGYMDWWESSLIFYPTYPGETWNVELHYEKWGQFNL